MKLTSDQLQNELLIIAHHLDDMKEGIKEKDLDYINKGIKDIREVVERLSKFLSKKEKTEIERMAEYIDSELPEESPIAKINHLATTING